MNIHTEGNAHKGTYTRSRHIHSTDCLNVLNHLLDGLSTRWTGPRLVDKKPSIWARPICLTRNLVDENRAHLLDKIKGFWPGYLINHLCVVKPLSSNAIPQNYTSAQSSIAVVLFQLVLDT